MLSPSLPGFSWRGEGRAIGGMLPSIVITRRLGLGLGLGLGRLGFNEWPCSAWHGSMPGNHAQVGLIRLFGGRSSAARTTFSLNAWSYVVRFFLPAPPEGAVGRMSDDTMMKNPLQHRVWGGILTSNCIRVWGSAVAHAPCFHPPTQIEQPHPIPISPLTHP